MDTSLCTKKNVTPSQAVEVFRKHGEEITQEEAEILLDFLYFFAKLSVNQQVVNITTKHALKKKK